jgi:hypothetical protein
MAYPAYIDRIATNCASSSTLRSVHTSRLARDEDMQCCMKHIHVEPSPWSTSHQRIYYRRRTSQRQRPMSKRWSDKQTSMTSTRDSGRSDHATTTSSEPPRSRVSLHGRTVVILYHFRHFPTDCNDIWQIYRSKLNNKYRQVWYWSVTGLRSGEQSNIRLLPLSRS